ncbi:MAG: amidohydrolase family protein, partial [Oscillospiraceae bacterium]|nr:amidohydrolase family protein [Oscillospiraceae bacterium]
MKAVFTNARIVRGGSIINGYAAISDGTVLEVGEGLPGVEYDSWTREDLEGAYLSPGFIDAHCHGGGGYDFLDGTVEAIVGAARAHMEHGTTSIAPTSLACADEDLFAFFENYKTAKKVTERMPNLMGIHLEGPFFSVEQAGAQPPHYLKNPTLEYAEDVLRRAEGNIIRWSMAPELPGAMEVGDWLSERGVMISIAHTDAEYPVIADAVQHGFTHMTHFYSGMGMLRRKNAFRVLGAVECGYLFDELNIEIIADGMHLPPELLKLILKCKPHDKISLVTDRMRGAGMPDGPSGLGNMMDGVPVIL